MDNQQAFNKYEDDCIIAATINAGIPDIDHDKTYSTITDLTFSKYYKGNFGFEFFGYASNKGLPCVNGQQIILRTSFTNCFEKLSEALSKGRKVVFLLLIRDWGWKEWHYVTLTNRRDGGFHALNSWPDQPEMFLSDELLNSKNNDFVGGWAIEQVYYTGEKFKPKRQSLFIWLREGAKHLLSLAAGFFKCR